MHKVVSKNGRWECAVCGRSVTYNNKFCFLGTPCYGRGAQGDARGRTMKAIAEARTAAADAAARKAEAD